MWLGNYSFVNLIGLFLQSCIIQNMLLFYFLGMCSYLACSNKISTAHGLGSAVTFVMVITGTLNWFVHRFITGDGALQWLSVMGIDGAKINLSFLEFLIFISVIAGVVQVLEILIDKLSPTLYAALGVYLPLITVNCAILGGVLFSTARGYPLIPAMVYFLGSGLGWHLAILLIAAIRDKLTYSNVVPGLRGIGITFVATGLMALSFMALTGIDLAKVDKSPPTEVAQESKPLAKQVKQGV